MNPEPRIQYPEWKPVRHAPAILTAIAIFGPVRSFWKMLRIVAQKSAKFQEVSRKFAQIMAVVTRCYAFLRVRHFFEDVAIIDHVFAAREVGKSWPGGQERNKLKELK